MAIIGDPLPNEVALGGGKSVGEADEVEEGVFFVEHELIGAFIPIPACDDGRGENDAVEHAEGGGRGADRREIVGDA